LNNARPGSFRSRAALSTPGWRYSLYPGSSVSVVDRQVDLLKPAFNA